MLILLISVSLYSYYNVPYEYKIEGGSCYQGISVMIIHFFLKICSLLCFVSLMLVFFHKKLKNAFYLSIIAFVFWLIGAFLNSIDRLKLSILYFSPLLIVYFIVLLFVFYEFKSHEKFLKSKT